MCIHIYVYIYTHTHICIVISLDAGRARLCRIRTNISLVSTVALRTLLLQLTTFTINSNWTPTWKVSFNAMSGKLLKWNNYFLNFRFKRYGLIWQLAHCIYWPYITSSGPGEFLIVGPWTGNGAIPKYKNITNMRWYSISDILLIFMKYSPLYVFNTSDHFVIGLQINA